MNYDRRKISLKFGLFKNFDPVRINVSKNQGKLKEYIDKRIRSDSSGKNPGFPALDLNLALDLMLESRIKIKGKIRSKK